MRTIDIRADRLGMGSRALRGLLRCAVALALFTLVFAWSTGVARLDLNQPLQYSGDSLEMLAYFDHDYIHNDSDTRLHAPFELDHKQQAHYLFNALFQSNSNLIWLSWLAAGGDDVRALNFAYLGTFLLAFLSAYWVCARLGLSNPFRFCAASMYALMPYHLGRGVAHFWESSYYLTPLLALLIVRLWSARPLAYHWSDGAWRFNLRDRRLIWALLLLVFLSSFNPYHQFFFVCLAASIAPLAALYRRSWKPLVAGSILAGAALAVLALKDVIAHQLVSRELALALNGQAIGGYGGAENYPLKLAQLVLPISGHRWQPFAELRALYDVANPLNNENSTTSLGLIGALGLLPCLLLALVPDAKLRMSRLGKMGLIIWIAIAFAMMGGLSSLVSTASVVLFGPNFVLTQMRGWNRIVIFIAFFAYFGAFYFLQEALKVAHKRFLLRIPPILVVWPAAALVLVFAIWDAVGVIGQVAPPHYQSDKRFFAMVEASLPADARVLQLPYLIHHASAWIEGVYYTDALRPYLNTKTLHFTYGGDVNSEQAGWLKDVTELSAADAAPLLCSYGFSGVLLQRNMVKNPASVEQPWTALLEEQPLQSEDGDYSFYALRPFCTSHRVDAIDMQQVKQRMLDDRARGAHTFGPGELPKQIGHLEQDASGSMTVAADADEEGFLAFGPFENLRDGTYTAMFSVAIVNVAGTDTPCVFNIAEGPSAIRLAEMEYRRSTAGIKQFQVQFTTKNSRALQYRVFKPRGYTMKLVEVQVSDDRTSGRRTATQNHP